MERTERITNGAIEMTWDPERRVATLQFARATQAAGPDAAVLIEALAGWIGTDGERFGLLGDGRNLSGLDAEYRSRWGSFLRAHRTDAFLAFYNMNAFVRIAADMFRIGTGLQLRAFADEPAARAWLRESGIRA